ncbi:uncharacterized protein FFNC_15696 [Fusarium fujikuroi]|nr:uncharacterized protein FFE2_01119 [Fusarium fujikuroi]SCO54950.1 uncharacterized protein FFNC_15696 [Fusarium fujikuroi]SCV27879.1 uncharacterized protein FFFS_01118 [Fusarium fujikuroi]
MVEQGIGASILEEL